MRKYFTILWLTFIFSLVCVLFYRMQWIYGLPTPVPANYHNVNPGTLLDIRKIRQPDSDKPLFIHFFNPECPCSKFNIPHFKALVQQYGASVNFVIVPISTRPDVTVAEIQEKFDLNIPVLMDSSISSACGVYSTPQAVIITPDGKLYFRGNYNKSRYCADKKTEYARLALEGLLTSDSPAVFDELAFKAYGCKLPLCTAK